MAEIADQGIDLANRAAAANKGEGPEKRCRVLQQGPGATSLGNFLCKLQWCVW